MIGLAEILGHILFYLVFFLVVLGVPAVIYRLAKRYRKGVPNLGKLGLAKGGPGEEIYDLPLIGTRVGCLVVDPQTKKEIEVTGILLAYGVFNGGKGIFKYLRSVRAVEDGRELGEILDLKGIGVEDWITCQRISSRDEMYQKLGLISPKHVAISSVGKWRDRGRLAWRKPNW